MGSEDQERERHPRSDTPDVEAHHFGHNKAHEEAKEPEDHDDDTPDVEGHVFGHNK